MPSPAVPLFDSADFSRAAAEAIVADTLKGAEDGELFVEKRQTESLVWDDGKLKSASFDESQGFGLRAVPGRDRRLCPCDRPFDRGPQARRRGLPHRGRPAAAWSTPCRRSAPTASSMPTPIRRRPWAFPRRSRCCRRSMPMPAASIRACKQVSVSLAGDWQAVEILRGDGSHLPRRAPAGALQRLDRLPRRQGTGPGQPWPRRPRRAALLFHRRRLAGRGARGAAPEPRVARSPPRAGGRDGRAARPRLARHPAA